jgi:hypothetical protein
MTSDKLYFHSRSKHVIAGKGVNVYDELNKDWRKVLSNSHIFPFQCKEYTYNTLEHLYQSQKIALVSPEKAYL